MGKDIHGQRLPLKDVIRRATTFHSSGPELSVEEIRSIAAELDLSPEAVEAAIREVEQGSVDDDASVRSSGDTSWIGLPLIAGGAASVVITFAGKYAGLDSLITSTMFASVSVATLNMWCASRLRGRLRYLTFNVSNALAWLAVSVAVSPLIVELAPVVFGGGAAIGGTIILALQDWKRASGMRVVDMLRRSATRRGIADTDDVKMRVSLRLRTA